MSNPHSWHGLPDNSFNPHAWIIGSPTIGEGTWIGAFCVIDGSGELTIGRNCDISAGVQIYTHSSVMQAVSDGELPIQRQSTHVGNNCHIGAGAIILMGCRIGDNCVVGAGAVVLEGTDVPSHSLVVGNPARVLPARARGKVEQDASTSCD